MSAQRVITAGAIVLCIASLAWNLRLHGQIANLEAELMAQPGAVDVQAAPTREAPPKRRSARSGPPTGVHPGVAAATPGSADTPNPGEEATTGRAEPDWQAMRAEMQTNTIDTVEAYAAQHNWQAETTDEVLAILLDSGDAIGEVWSAVGSGELTHFKARKEMHAIRDESGQDIVALVGEEAYEALEEHLFEARRETWRRSHGDGGHGQ